MNRAHHLLHSLLAAVGTGVLLVSPAQGTDWVAVPGYNDGYYDSDTARRSIGEAGHHGQGMPQGERGRRPATTPPPPRRGPDAWSEDWRTYPERWQGNPYQGGWDPWYVRERQRGRRYRDEYERDQYRRWRELNRAINSGSDP